MSAIPLSALATTGQWQEDFLRVLPAIQTHAKIRFRHLPAGEREEAIAEAIAAAVVNYRQLVVLGKLRQAYVASLANFAVRHAAQDRHVGGRQNVRDVLSPLAQRKQGFEVRSLGKPHDYYGLKPRVTDDGRFTPADAAAFRIDFADWLRSQANRERKIIKRFISGEGTLEVAKRFGVSQARISQLRRKFQRSWEVFQGEAA